jgi:DNA ligase-1
MTDIKPMLAGKLDPKKLKFPVIVQPKYDGIRAMVIDGKILTRTLKEVPNRYIFDLLSKPEYEGLDGELIVGDPVAEDCYRQTVHGVMGHDDHVDFTFIVFDIWNCPDDYVDRYELLCQQPLPDFCQIVKFEWALDQAELDQIEEELIDAGHEGGIVRGPNTPYKFGRGSNRDGDLLKLKRFTDAEASVVNVVEELHNGNQATTNALGRTERSSHKDNKVGKGTMGALIVEDLETGVEFKIGTGFDASQRADIWAQFHKNPETILGKLAKYKSFPVGVKDKPRHPVFLGWRDERDL